MIRRIAELRLAKPVFDRRQIVVADPHLNGPGRQDNFQRELFGEILDAFPPSEAGLIFVGDIFDRYECRSDKAICRHNADTLDRIADYEVLAVEGNHDLPKKTARLVYETPLVWIWHGHQLDAACSGPGGWIGYTAGAVWGALERVGLAWAFEWARRLAVARTMKGRITASLRGGDNAVQRTDALARLRALYIGGHTHREELTRLRPGMVYLNPGNCSTPGRITFAEISGQIVRLYEATRE